MNPQPPSSPANGLTEAHDVQVPPPSPASKQPLPPRLQYVSLHRTQFFLEQQQKRASLQAAKSRYGFLGRIFGWTAFSKNTPVVTEQPTSNSVAPPVSTTSLSREEQVRNSILSVEPLQPLPPTPPARSASSQEQIVEPVMSWVPDPSLSRPESPSLQERKIVPEPVLEADSDAVRVEVPNEEIEMLEIMAPRRSTSKPFLFGEEAPSESNPSRVQSMVRLFGSLDSNAEPPIRKESKRVYLFGSGPPKLPTQLDNVDETIDYVERENQKALLNQLQSSSRLSLAQNGTFYEVEQGEKYVRSTSWVGVKSTCDMGTQTLLTSTQLSHLLDKSNSALSVSEAVLKNTRKRSIESISHGMDTFTLDEKVAIKKQRSETEKQEPSVNRVTFSEEIHINGIRQIGLNDAVKEERRPRRFSKWLFEKLRRKSRSKNDKNEQQAKNSSIESNGTSSRRKSWNPLKLLFRRQSTSAQVAPAPVVPVIEETNQLDNDPKDLVRQLESQAQLEEFPRGQDAGQEQYIEKYLIQAGVSNRTNEIKTFHMVTCVK